MSLSHWGTHRFAHPLRPEHLLARGFEAVHATRLLRLLPSLALGVMVAMVTLVAPPVPAAESPQGAGAEATVIPPGAAALGYVKCVINEKPTAADVAPGRNGDYKWFSGQWWSSKKPPLGKYSTRDGVLVLSLGGDLVSVPHDFSTGKLPLLLGRDGFYVEFEYWLSDVDPDHFPAVWLMPAEHNGARQDRYGGDPPDYERWMELDIDEGGFGPGLTGTVHSHYGIYEQKYQHIQSPNNVSRVALDRTKKHTFGASYDPRSQTVTWWVDGVKQMSAGSPYVPEVGARQSFYLIVSAQSHGKQKPYSLFVGGVRAYVPPSSPLPAWKGETQADLPGQAAATAEVRPEGRDFAALAAAIQRSAAGTTIRLPEGTFELTESVRLKSGVKLIGSGQDKTVLTYSGDQPAPFINLTDCEDVEIAHLTLDGCLRSLGQDGVRAGNCRKLRLHDLGIRNLAKGKTPFVHGIIFSGHNPTMERGVTDSVISDCRIENIGLGAEYGGGIRMAWGSVRNRVERNIIRTTGRGGIFGDHSAELVIRNNQVSGSGGEGLGIEIWGGCPRSLIEDNVVDHWISVDQGNQSAVRRNVVGIEDDSLKGFGIEIIASDVVVTDNLVKRGASVGLSVSNRPKKNNVFWGYNTIRECTQWGAQLQGETGGIAHHYFYRCTFEKTVRGDPRARYPQDSGHGLRFNGSSREVVFEECAFRDNGGYGVQFVGANVDAVSFLRCVFANNRQGLVTGLLVDKTVEFKDCTAGSDAAGVFPPTKAFSTAPPVADFRMPPVIHVGAAAPFECTSKSGAGDIVERLWDFNHGIAEVGAHPQHSFDQPGRYRVTLIVWDAAGRGARAERTVEVLPAP
jgi:hypothetical protein